MGILWGASALHRAPDGPRCQQVVHQRASASISCKCHIGTAQSHQRYTLGCVQYEDRTAEQVAASSDIEELIRDRGARVPARVSYHTARFQPFDATLSLNHAYTHTEFEWSPASHQLIAHSYHTFTRNVIELLMIRDMPDAASSIPWLPNELMFEIFRALFDAYYRQPQ